MNAVETQMTGRVLFLSLARGGSKGVPRKNLRKIGGIPLVGRAARLGRNCLNRIGGNGRVLVSTDDEEIAAAARAYGAEVPFLRPAELAGDRTPSAPVVLHAIEWYRKQGEEFDAVVLIQPTAPLTTPEDVLDSLEMFQSKSGKPVVTITDAEHSVDLQFQLVGSKLVPAVDRPLAPERHDRPREVRLATSVYVCSPDWLTQHAHWVVPGETHGVWVPPERAVEIDSELELQWNELLHHRQLPWSDDRVMVIAEAGVNHNGDLRRALKMVDMAADAGADAVKFQCYQASRLISLSTPQADYQKQNTRSGESMLELMQRFELSPGALSQIADHCRDRGVLFSASVFDDQAPEILDRMAVPFFKIPSGEITNLPLLVQVARTFRPIVLSTGMSNLAEVAAAIETIHRAGNRDVAVLHCTSDYPCSAADVHLRAMTTLREAFGVPVGYSDHTLGYEVSCAAVAMGARILEKHFTLDKKLPGPDHAASLDPEELRVYIRAVRNVEAALGSPRKQPTAADERTAMVARKSLVASRDLPIGHRLRETDLSLKRPGTGLPPMMWDAVLGRTLNRPLVRDELLDWEALS